MWRWRTKDSSWWPTWRSRGLSPSPLFSSDPTAVCSAREAGSRYVSASSC